MNSSQIILDYKDLLIASSLILINASISVVLKLDLARSLIISALRMVIQLSLIGYVLQWIFKTQNPWWVLLILTLMTLVAGTSAGGKGKYIYAGRRIDATLSVWFAAWSSLFVGVVFILQVAPWYSPQYLIPTAGMILGNSMNSIALSLNRISSELAEKRKQIELLQSFGANNWEAFREMAKSALHVGLLPVINQMSMMGLVSLPGMMTGQILAGQDPHQAILYQILTMFLIGASSAIGTLLAVLLVYYRLFNQRYEFKYWQIHRR